MRYVHTYPAPTLGVSTLEARNQPEGMMVDQVNLRSDPVKKLSRRASMDVGEVIDTTLWKAYHTYDKEGTKVEVGIDENDNIKVLAGGNSVSVGANLDENTVIGAEGNIRMHTIRDTTFILNTRQTVSRTEFIQPKVFDIVWPMINVLSALNYGEKVVIDLEWDTGLVAGVVYSSSNTAVVTKASIELEIPNAVNSDYTAADKARATYEVAAQLAIKLKALTLHEWGYFSGNSNLILLGNGKPFYNSESRGSTVVVGADATDNLQISVGSGQGDKSVKVFNEVIQDTDGLPKYGIEGTRVTVQPGIGNTAGTYYLLARRTGSTPSTDTVNEIYWEEVETQYETSQLDGSTMPITVSIGQTSWGAWSALVSNEDSVWENRSAGDDDSNPMPSFVGTKITAMETFQGRLALGTSRGEVVMSSTDNVFQFFRRSVLQLLTTDVVDLGSSSVDADAVTHIAIHDEDLIVNYKKAQMKVSGKAPITPQSGTLTPSTNFDTVGSVKPLAFETSLLLPFSYGGTAGVWDYTQRAQTEQNTAMPLTRIVEGYMEGDIEQWAASSSLGMVVVKCAKDDTLYVYEQETVQGSRTQMSWSRWEIEDLGDVLWLGFDEQSLRIVTRKLGYTHNREIDMSYREADAVDNIYLDHRLVLNIAEGATAVALPADYEDTVDTVYVQGSDCSYPNQIAECTRIGNVITIPDEIYTGSGGSTLFIGRPYTSGFTLPQQFIRDEAGINTVDRLRIKKITLDVVHTNEVSLETLSKYGDNTIISLGADEVGNLLLGEPAFKTGDLVFPYKQESSHANARIYTDGFLPMNVIALAWEGLYKQSRRKI